MIFNITDKENRDVNKYVCMGEGGHFVVVGSHSFIPSTSTPFTEGRGRKRGLADCWRGRDDEGHRHLTFQVFSAEIISPRSSESLPHTVEL